MVEFYRVRHPAAPELFVWLAGERRPDGAFLRPLPIHSGDVKWTFATLTVVFTSVHGGYTKTEAEELAAFIGGTVEKVEL